MLSVDKKNILTSVASVPLDPAVGIQIARLWQDPDKSYYATSIMPGKRIAAHYHNEGDELYVVIGGSGFMRLGTPVSTGVEWEQEFEVQSGDFFTVAPKMVHQLVNTSKDENLVALFGCVEDHMGADRFVIQEQ